MFPQLPAHQKRASIGSPVADAIASVAQDAKVIGFETSEISTGSKLASSSLFRVEFRQIVGTCNQVTTMKPSVREEFFEATSGCVFR